MSDCSQQHTLEAKNLLRTKTSVLFGVRLFFPSTLTMDDFLLKISERCGTIQIHKHTHSYTYTLTHSHNRQTRQKKSGAVETKMAEWHTHARRRLSFGSGPLNDCCSFGAWVNAANGHKRRLYPHPIHMQRLLYFRSISPLLEAYTAVCPRIDSRI